MRARRVGITLVEVILAMAIATAVVGVLAAAVSRVIQSNAAAQDHLHTVVTLGRLGEQFRRDAHAALDTSIEEINDRPARLKFTTEAGRTIEYEITPDGLARVASGGDHAEHRERFALVGMKPLGWRLDEDGRAISLDLGRLARPQSDDATLGGRFSIVASLAPARPAAAPAAE
jgi:type II secretory pathway component PulJ